VVSWILAMLLPCAALTAAVAGEPARTLSFPTADGGTVSADLYGERGREAVVLAHGAAFDKTSWRPLAVHLAAHGYQVLAIDFRGYGRSRAGTDKDALFEDILAAVRYLGREGAPRVAVVGASMGGAAAARAAAAAKPGEIDRLVLLSPAPVADPERLKGRLLFVASRDEPNAERVRELYRRAPEPKRLLELPGSAHAQRIFDTDQAELLRTAILEFLAGR
jgi:pimeloyl-ACP methyl ester carboxylesterase